MKFIITLTSFRSHSICTRNRSFCQYIRKFGNLFLRESIFMINLKLLLILFFLKSKFTTLTT